MRDKIKYFVSGFTLAICLTILINQSVKSQASTDLQSTGKIVFNNPTTGQEEIVFDANDQDKLKNNISAIEQRYLELKDNIDMLGNSLGGFTPIIDEITGEVTGYKTNVGGADTVFPFSQELGLIDGPLVLNSGSNYLYTFTEDYSKIILVVQFGHYAKAQHVIPQITSDSITISTLCHFGRGDDSAARGNYISIGVYEITNIKNGDILKQADVYTMTKNYIIY